MKIAHIDKSPMDITFHASKDRDGFFLQWSPYGREFLFGYNQPGGPLRIMQNEKYRYAKNEKAARKLAQEFFDESGEGDE